MIVTRLHRLANQDVEQAVQYLAAKDGLLAERFLDSIAEARKSNRENPLAGSPYKHDCRFVKTKKFRYVLYYRFYEAEQLAEVFAVAHASRRPGYWLRRTRRP